MSMSDVKHYGKTAVEQRADDSLKCRQITRTIIDFGVSEAEKLKIIYLLSLELENRDQMLEISAAVKRLEEGQRRSTLITEID